MLRKKVTDYIVSHNLLKKDGRYLVALSGGADSVALLLLMHDMGYQVEACHCNFHLREEESDRDEHFCINLCNSLGIVLHKTDFNTYEYAIQNRVSIEMAARDLRYEYFNKVLKERKLDAICVAHHQNDSAETLLINLLRGTGLHGLCGIKPVNGNVIRPLLHVTKKEITDYLDSRNQTFVTDSTNLTSNYIRNKIRLNIIPLMQEINPSACSSIADTAERMQEISAIYDKYITEAISRIKKNEYTYSVRHLLSETSPSCILHEIMHPLGFNGAQEKQVMSSLNTSGKTFNSHTYTLITGGEFFYIEANNTDYSTEITITGSGEYTIPGEKKLLISFDRKDKTKEIWKDKHRVMLDKDSVTFPLILRYTKQGDRFVPFGMKGKVLVSDYLTNRKMSLFWKHRQMVLTDTDGNIIWLVGERTSEKNKVTDKTKEILRITIEE